MRKIFIGVLALIASAASAQVVGFETNFQINKLSDLCQLIDYDECAVNSAISTPFTNKTWRTYSVGKNNMGAICASALAWDVPADDWMITPVINVSLKEFILKWDARALHPDRRDGYKVMISTTGTAKEDFSLLWSVDQEQPVWQTHIVSLASYVGQNVYIAFVNDSYNKFILAVDNLLVGVPATNLYKVEDATARFNVYDTDVPVTGTVRNVGAAVSVAQMQCSVNGQTYTLDVNREIATDESFDYSFDIPAASNDSVHYQLSLTDAQGLQTPLCEDVFYNSYYPRNLLIEEMTALWCSNCPLGTVALRFMERRYKDQISVITAHKRDIYANDTYDMISSNIYSIPTAFINRYEADSDMSYNSENQSMKKALMRPVLGQISALEAAFSDDDSQIQVQACAEFALALDNSQDNYRIGFSVVEKSVKFPDASAQSNSCNSSVYGFCDEYAHLDSRISNEFITLHNVARNCGAAYQGVAELLPAAIVAGEPVQISAALSVPSDVSDRSNLALVAILINTKTGEVYNSTELCDIQRSSSSALVGAQGSLLEAGVAEGQLQIKLAPSLLGCDFSVKAFTAQGVCLVTAQGVAAGETISMPVPEYQGLIMWECSCGSEKFVLKSMH